MARRGARGKSGVRHEQETREGGQKSRGGARFLGFRVWGFGFRVGAGEVGAKLQVPKSKLQGLAKQQRGKIILWQDEHEHSAVQQNEHDKHRGREIVGRWGRSLRLEAAATGGRRVRAERRRREVDVYPTRLALGTSAATFRARERER